MELIISQTPLIIDKERIPANKIMKLKIGYRETYLRKLVKDAGGKWNKEEHVWELIYKTIVELGLEERIK